MRSATCVVPASASPATSATPFCPRPWRRPAPATWTAWAPRGRPSTSSATPAGTTKTASAPTTPASGSSSRCAERRRRSMTPSPTPPPYCWRSLCLEGASRDHVTKGAADWSRPG
nr:uncharacterized protein LOC113808493 [Penaeus vannamei]